MYKANVRPKGETQCSNRDVAVVVQTENQDGVAGWIDSRPDVPRRTKNSPRNKRIYVLLMCT